MRTGQFISSLFFHIHVAEELYCLTIYNNKHTASYTPFDYQTYLSYFTFYLCIDSGLIALSGALRVADTLRVLFA
jgi:hypothetical protein